MEIYMKARIASKAGAAIALTCAALSQPALATTKEIDYSTLVASATAATPLAAGDTLFLNTFTTERGALDQTTTFTVAAGVAELAGYAAWEVTTAAGNAPRLLGVNIDIFNASNNLVYSDSFAGVLAGFAHSTLSGPLGAGTYHLVATGTGVRDSSLDISLTLAPVPEADAYALTLAGLGLIGFMIRRNSKARR
jgi:hypothetical protein